MKKWLINIKTPSLIEALSAQHNYTHHNMGQGTETWMRAQASSGPSLSQ